MDNKIKKLNQSNFDYLNNKRTNIKKEDKESRKADQSFAMGESFGKLLKKALNDSNLKLD